MAKDNHDNHDEMMRLAFKEDVKITIAIVPKNSAVVLQEPYNKDNVRLYYTRPESDNEFNRRTKYHGRPEGWRE